MKALSLFISALAVSLLSLSCSKSDDNCGPMEFSAVDFSKYTSVQIKDDKTEEVFLVINSKAELEQNVLIESVGGDDHELANLDYNKHTLLIGKAVASSIPGTLMSQTFEKDCDQGGYSYRISVQNGGYLALGKVFFGIIVPKITQEVKLKVELINRDF